MLRSVLYIAVALTMIPGCGGSDRPKLAPVTGTVTYKDVPLATGVIVFFPEEGRSGAGKIVEGKITDVTTFDPNDGAPVGALRISVTSITNEKEIQGEHKSLIPEKYGDPAKSGLKATVEAGEKNIVELKLTDD